MAEAEREQRQVVASMVPAEVVEKRYGVERTAASGPRRSATNERGGDDEEDKVGERRPHRRPRTTMAASLTAPSTPAPAPAASDASASSLSGRESHS